MTSHSSQGATVDRALIHIDTGDSRVRALIDETLAYVATSRPRYDAQIFTDDADRLTAALSRQHENATALSPEQISRLLAFAVVSMSLETILPFLQPIEHIVLDPDVSEVMVNGDGSDLRAAERSPVASRSGDRAEVPDERCQANRPVARE